jgi:hypothetical protein
MLAYRKREIHAKCWSKDLEIVAVLRWILGKQDVRMRIGFNWLRTNSAGRADELSGSITLGNFYQLNNYHFFKNQIARTRAPPGFFSGRGWRGQSEKLSIGLLVSRL